MKGKHTVRKSFINALLLAIIQFAFWKARKIRMAWRFWPFIFSWQRVFLNSEPILQSSNCSYFKHGQFGGSARTKPQQGSNTIKLFALVAVHALQPVN